MLDHPQTGSSYEFVTSLDKQLSMVQAVRLIGLRMPPLFIRTRTWEPFLVLTIDELGVRWPVHHTWYMTDHDVVDWCVMPEQHSKQVSPPVSCNKLSVSLLSSIVSGVPHIITAKETCDILRCSILLEVEEYAY
jgi:hypothetical protein